MLKIVILLIFVASMVNCRNNKLDLSKLELNENIEKYSDILDVEEARKIDLTENYKFYHMDPKGAIEKNKGNTFFDYYINPSKNITYNTIPFDELKLRVVNKEVIGFVFDSYDADDTKKMLNFLSQEYGKGRLISGESKQESQVYIWNKNENIINYSTVKYSEKMNNGKRKFWFGCVLVIANKQALEKGQWPFQRKLLDGLKMPNLNN